MISTALFALLPLLCCHQSLIGQTEAFVTPCTQRNSRFSSLRFYGPSKSDNDDDLLGNKNTTTYSARNNDTAPNDFNNKVNIHYSRSKKFPDRKKKESTSTSAKNARGIHYSRSSNFPDRQKGKLSANDNTERLSTFSFSSNAASKKQDAKKKKTQRKSVREFLSSSLSSIKGKIGKARSSEEIIDNKTTSTDDNTTSKEDEVPDDISSSSSETVMDEKGNLDPLCDIDDEDCHSFSTLDPEYNSLASPSLYDSQDNLDFQSLLPTTYLHSDSFLEADLRRRSESILNERVYDNWQHAHCPTTFVSVGQDWVRRVDMDTFPIAVCGGARGGVYVVNLEEKKVIAKVDDIHNVQVGQGGANPSKVNTNIEKAKQAMEKLYGKIDGGGVVAVAISGDLVASAGREGGVRLWKLEKCSPLPPVNNQDGKEERGLGQDSTLGKLSQLAGNAAKGKNSDRSEFKNINDVVEGKLIPLGNLKGLEKTIVTSLKFDSKQRLWASAYDGRTRAYDVSKCNDSNFRISAQKPVFQSDFTDSVLDMHLCEELHVGACATADGGVALFSLETGTFICGIMLFEVAARSVLILKQATGFSVICGGSNGAIHHIPLNVDSKTNRVDEDNPFDVLESTDTAMTPKHTGPVLCLASQNEGITKGMFISGGQDGTVRVWTSNGHDSGSRGTDVVGTEQNRPAAKCIYALTGYKLWLGSICTDGQRIVSDGGENSIIVRDFSKEKGNGRASL
mmetsp:Transcript_14606/g.22521  ORF Transcript_14606/g.22521 Transcript_14606/m.22521 type:complete len:735 (-) Transcript_14606:55-2259(-)